MRVGYILAAVALAACSQASDPGTFTAGPADPPPESAGPVPEPPAQPPETPLEYPLFVEVTGAGGFQVSADQPGIQCGDTCTLYPQGTTVTLTAAPQAGARLLSWGGACSGAPDHCVLMLFETIYVAIHFESVPEVPSYELRHVELGEGLVRVTDVNAEGDVLGTVYYDAVGNHYTPFIWHFATGEVTYLELGVPPTRAQAVALNDRGAAVVREWTGHYWLYEDGHARPVLPDLGIDVSDLGDQGWLVGGIGPEAMLYEPACGTLIKLGEREVVGVNGQGVLVGTRGDEAVLVASDGSSTSLGMGSRSRAVGITKGGVVYGVAGSTVVDPATGSTEPATGFFRNLTTGTTTYVRPSGDLVGIRALVAVDDQGEALVTGALGPPRWVSEPLLWSRGTFAPVSALATFPAKIADAPAMNARGQIIVNYYDQGPRAAILTPRRP